MGINLDRFRKKQNQDWLDWLSDEPTPASVRNRMRVKAVQEASRPVPRSNAGPKAADTTPGSKDDQAKTVSIHISIPSTDALKRRAYTAWTWVVRHKPPRMVAIGAGSALVIGGLVVGSALFIHHNKQQQSDDSSTAVLSDQTEKPNFDYSLPKGDVSKLEKEPRFDAKRQVVNYVDSIGGVEITVSQQPLPEGFKDNTEDKVKKLAEDFTANHVLATANPTAYLGTSAKGPQTVIFAKKDLLVFIQSTSKIDDHDWAEYITSLK